MSDTRDRPSACHHRDYRGAKSPYVPGHGLCMAKVGSPIANEHGNLSPLAHPDTVKRVYPCDNALKTKASWPMGVGGGRV